MAWPRPVQARVASSLDEHIWCWRRHDDAYHHRPGRRIEWFTDGITFDANNNPSNVLDPAVRAAQDKHNRGVRQLVKSYLTAKTPAKRAPGSLNGMSPGGINGSSFYDGGCALCCFVENGGSSALTALIENDDSAPIAALVGEQIGNTAHLYDHLIGGFMPYNVWHRAVSATGCLNPLARIAFADIAKRDVRRCLLNALVVGPVWIKNGKTPYGKTNHRGYPKAT